MDKLDVILLIGRPAAGKSETIDFLKQLPDERRLQEYHIAPFEELDDFLYVWQTFEDDNIREHMGLPRRDTDANLYFLDDRIWDFFIERIDLDFRKKLARDPLFLEHHTVMMERYYKDNDWERLSGGHDEGFIAVKGHQVPFAVFHNEPEKTLDPELLGAALRDVTGRLVKLFTHKG